MGLKVSKDGVTVCAFVLGQKDKGSHSSNFLHHTPYVTYICSSKPVGGCEVLEPVSETTHIVSESKVGTFPPRGRSTIVLLPDPYRMTVSRAKE